MVLMEISSGCCSVMIGSSQDMRGCCRSENSLVQGYTPLRPPSSQCAILERTRRTNMKIGVRRLAVSMAFMAIVAMATSPALAQGSRMGQRDGQNDGQHNGQVPPNTPQPSSPFNRIYAPLPYNPRPVIQRPFAPSTFGNSVIVVPSPVAPPLPPAVPYGYGYDQSVGVSPG